MKSLFQSFGFSALASLAAVIAVTVWGGLDALIVTIILVAIEIAFSFDNAVVNAKVLVKLSPLWRKLFLTVGIVIAIFGMRIVFPIAIVALTAHIPWHDVLNLALNYPEKYAEQLELAHPAITGFGGAFLLMLALHFFIDDEKEHDWFQRFEKPMRKFGEWWLPTLVTLAVLGGLALLPANHHAMETFQAGIVGIVVYGALTGFTWLIERLSGKGSTGIHQTGWVAFGTFIYLQILDASFSFDGVIGAFAITNKIILIAVGLGIGAVWVRSLTVFMVERGTLAAYKYLEHGAHYAILALALVMLLAVVVDVPEVITGSAGIGLIIASIMTSKQARRSHQHAG